MNYSCRGRRGEVAITFHSSNHTGKVVLSNPRCLLLVERRREWKRMGRETGERMKEELWRIITIVNRHDSSHAHGGWAGVEERMREKMEVMAGVKVDGGRKEEKEEKERKDSLNTARSYCAWTVFARTQGTLQSYSLITSWGAWPWLRPDQCRDSTKIFTRGTTPTWGLLKEPRATYVWLKWGKVGAIVFLKPQYFSRQCPPFPLSALIVHPYWYHLGSGGVLTRLAAAIQQKL